jgi:hypothetical protein
MLPSELQVGILLLSFSFFLVQMKKKLHYKKSTSIKPFEQAQAASQAKAKKGGTESKNKAQGQHPSQQKTQNN